MAGAGGRLCLVLQGDDGQSPLRDRPGRGAGAIEKGGGMTITHQDELEGLRAIGRIVAHEVRPRVPLSVLAAEQTMWTERDELDAMNA